MSKLRLACATVAAVVLAPLIATVGPPISAAAGGYCSLDGSSGLTTFRWTGAAGDSLWSTDGNWEDDEAPDLVDAASGYVCINAAADEDLDSDTVYMVPDTFNTPGSGAGPGTSAMLQVLDLASGTLSINYRGKLYLYGDPATRQSYVRQDARLELTMGILGGSGRLNLDGEMQWTAAQRGSSAMKSSCRGIAGDDPGDPPFDMDVLPEFCPPAADPPDGAGRLVVGGSLTIRSGALDASGNLTDDGLVRGVDLAQRYGIDVATGGEVHVAGSAYLAQSHTATIDIQDGGEWTFDGDGDVYEGFFEGTPAGPLPPFVNEGTLSKASGSGGSSINTAYSGGGTVVVQNGALTTPGGFPVLVEVQAGESVGSWDCPPVDFGTPAEDCEFDDADDSSVTSGQDLQAAILKVPSSAGSDARVQVRETDAMGPDDLQPQIAIASANLEPSEETELGFEFNGAIGLPVKANISIFRKAGAANWREVPRCTHAVGSPLPRGVSACVRGNPRDRAQGGGVRLKVETNRPRGRWVLRSRRADTGETIRSIVPRDDGTFDFLDGLPAPAETLTVPSEPEYCGSSGAGAWSLHRVLEDRDADDHSVGWHRSASGQARGLTVPVGDLADVDQFAVSLRRESGELRGYAWIERVETANVAWRASAHVTLEDTDPTGSGQWRIANARSLTFRWNRFVNGVRDPDAMIEAASVEDFFADAAGDKGAGTVGDRVGFAFGCAGEDVQLNDVIVRKVVEDVDSPTTTLAWDLETRVANAQITQLADIGDQCQLARTDWPNVVRRGVTATAGADWVMEWAPTADGTWAQLKKPNGNDVAGTGTALDIPIQLPRQRGVIRVRVASSDNFRKYVSPLKLFKAVPAIDLLKITRTVFVGQLVTLRGKVLPARADHLQLWATKADRRILLPRDRRARVDAQGRFVITFKAPRTGRFALTVRYVAPDGSPVQSAMAREVFFTTVKKKPKPPPPPPPVVPTAQDVSYVDDHDQDPIERSDRAACVYSVGR